MSGPHRISLQAAWDADGPVWTRSFGRPSGIGEHDRVWLVLACDGGCVAALNGHPLETSGIAGRHDVTSDLRRRNSLRIEFIGTSGSVAARRRTPLPASLAVVALEIESHT